MTADNNMMAGLMGGMMGGAGGNLGLLSMLGGGGSLNMDKIKDRMFKSAENIVWDLTTGKLGVKTKDGIISMNGEGEDAEITMNMMENFGIAVPAFAQNTPVDQVKTGDLIYFGAREQPGWVTAVKERKDAEDKVTSTRFTLLKTNGETSSWAPPKVQILGMGDSGVMVLRSLVNLLPGGSSGLNGFNASLNSMLMMQMLTGGEADLDSIMPMMLMMGGMGGSGGMGDMMQMVMLSKLMGNGGMGGLFGGGKADNKAKSPFTRG